MSDLSTFVSIISMFTHATVSSIKIHGSQFLGCFREGLDVASRDLLYDVRNNFEDCAVYCIRHDSLVFGMTDDGSCACQLASYDMYDGFIKDWCRNPCQGSSTYSEEYSCGGGVIFMSYYRVCPPFTYGMQCENFCMCASSVCHGISGICYKKGCLDPATDTSTNDDYSVCPTMYCEGLNGGCKTICQGSPTLETFLNCSCDTGFEFSLLRLSCEDINECANPMTRDCDVCINTQGSFECLCHPPKTLYTISGKSICQPPHLFDDVCSSCTKDKVCEIVGTQPTCVCPSGLISTPDGDRCYHRIRCKDLDYCHICDIEVDYISCRCRTGYALYDHYVCLDVNECETSNCKSCVNFPGSSICQCPEDCMCSDPMTRPLCKATYITTPVNFNYLGGGNFPNKAVYFFTHQEILLGVFADSPLRYITTVNSYWSIPGMVNKTVTGPFFRLHPKLAKPGNFTATITFRHFTKRKIMKLYFTVMVYVEYYIEPAGVVVKLRSEEHKVKVLPYIKIGYWYCDQESKAMKDIVRVSTSCNLTFTRRDNGSGISFQTTAVTPAVTDAKPLTIYFLKKIRINQMAYDSVTFVYKPSGLAEICTVNCGPHVKANEDIKYAQSSGSPGDNYFYWYFGKDRMLVKFGIGVNTFELPIEFIWKLPTKNYFVYLKRTSLRDMTQTQVFAHNFRPREKVDVSDCRYDIENSSYTLLDRIMKSVVVECTDKANVHNIFLGDCDEPEPPNIMRDWLYAGKGDPVTMYFIAGGNVLREYCFIDHKIQASAEFVSESRFTLTEADISGTPLDVRDEVSKIPNEFTAPTSREIHRMATRLYSLIRIMNSKLRISHDGTLIIEYEGERRHMAEYLNRLLESATSRSNMFLLTKSFEALTQYIEALEISNPDPYRLVHYIQKFQEIARTQAGDKIHQRFCSEEDFYRIVMKSLSNLVFGYVRELEMNPGQQVSLTKYKAMIKETMSMALQGVSQLRRNVTISMDFLQVHLVHFSGARQGSTLVIPDTDERPFKVQFEAPATDFTVQISSLVFEEMEDNEINFKIVPVVVNVTSGSRKVDLGNGLKISYLLPRAETSSFYNFVIDSARITLASPNIISNGTSVFEMSFVVKFYSLQKSIHNVQLNVFLCPESVEVYDDKTLEVSCNIKSKSDYLFAGHGVWTSTITALRKEYVTNVFKVILAIENIFEAVSSNISLMINKLACLAYKESVGNWSYKGCKNSVEAGSSPTCHYATSDEYSAFRLTIPMDLNADSGKVKNFFGLGLVGLIWLLGIIVGLWAAMSDAKAEVECIPIDLADNPLRGLFCYLVIINTGNVMNAGAQSNIFLTLYGSMNQRAICCLKNSFFPVLRRGSKNCFIMRSRTSLGHILIVQMWHRGIDSVSNWFVHDIKVIDLQTQSSYYFLCYSWVGINNVDWKSSLLCIIVTYEEFHKISHLLPHNVYRYIQYKHKLLSIFFMSGIDRLSRFDRVMSYTFRMLFIALITLFSFGKGFDLGLLYVNIAGIQGTVIMKALFAVLYTSVVTFFVDLALLTMKWLPHPVVFAKDNILGIQRGVEITSLRIVNNVLKVMLHFVRPRDAEVSADDADMGQSMFGNLFYLKVKYFLRQFTPGVFFILSILSIMSLLIFALSYTKNTDHIHNWKEMLFISFVVNFIVADSVEFILTVLIFSFIVKAEIHPEVVNTEKILYTVRRELADSSGLILADAIATRKKNIKYKRPMRNQFTTFTRKNKLHGIVSFSRYVDMFFAVALLAALMAFCIFGYVGPSAGVRQVNSFLTRSFKEEQARQIVTKEHYWDYIENVVMKQIHSHEDNETDSDKKVNATDDETFEEFLLGNVTDEDLSELMEANAFEDFLNSIYLLPNNVTFALKAICLKILAAYKYSLVIMFDEMQPSSWRSYCFTNNQSVNHKILKEVIKKSSFHKNVKGLAIKLFLYTPDVHVFSMFTMATVNTPSGRLRTKMEVLSRKFYNFSELREIFIFFCIFLGLSFCLIVTYLLHLYYDGIYTFVIIFRLLIQTLSLVCSLFFILSILVSLQEPYDIFTDRSMFFNVSFSTIAERMKSAMYILVVFFTLLRPIMFIAHKFRLGRFYWNETFTHLHQAYTLVLIVLIGHGISMLWHLKSYYRLRSLREAMLISALTIYHAAESERLAKGSWCYLNVIIFLIYIVIIKWVIFSRFFYMKEWRQSKSASD